MKCECGRAYQLPLSSLNFSRLLRAGGSAQSHGHRHQHYHLRTVLFLAWFAVTCSVSFPVPAPSTITRDLRDAASLRPHLDFAEQPAEEADEDIKLKPEDSPYERLRPNFYEDLILLRPGEAPFETQRTSKHPDTASPSSESSSDPNPRRSRATVDAIATRDDIDGDAAAKRSVQDGEESPRSHRVWCERRESPSDPLRDGIVPWKYHPSLDDRVDDKISIRNAMLEIQKHTCVEFVPYNPNVHRNYIHLTYTRTECSSFVGMLGGEQAVKISHLCDSIGNIMHELGHVLNLWHEQSRRDRDEYILINEDNIKDGKKNNFDVLNEYQWEMRAPNVSYDLCSLMHYGPYAFAKDTSKPTIEVLNTTRGPFPCPHPLGQREELSFKDKLKINLLYSCHNETAALLQPPAATPVPSPTPTPGPTPLPTPGPNPVVNATNTTVTEEQNDEETITTTTPTPATMEPPRKKKEKITPGLTILLELQEDGGNPTMEYLDCDTGRGCGLDECSHAQFQAGCSTTQRLEILLPSLKNKIKSGDDIVLRSTRRLGSFIDCHGSACELTSCYNNQGDPNSNSSTFVSFCENHMFRIIAMNRAEHKTLKDQDIVVLQNSTEGSFLHCSGSVCQTLLPSCSEWEGSEESDRFCGVQRFKITVTN